MTTKTKTPTKPSANQFFKDVLGIKLSKAQRRVLEGIERNEHSCIACGRRGGKSLIASGWAVYDGVVRDLRKYLRPGEVRYIILVAAGFSQAKALFRTVKAFFEIPMLSVYVKSETADEIELTTNVILKVIPCNSRTGRGLAASTVIFEELAAYQDSEGFQSGEAVYAALSPSVAQFGAEGRVISLSTPQGQRGVFWRLYQQAESRKDGYAVNLPTWEMNPTITKESLEPEREANAWLYDQEYLASFLAGGDEFISLASLQAATGIQPHEHDKLFMAIDPAFFQDDFGLAVACRPRDAPQVVVVEHVSVLRKPGFDKAMDEVEKLAHLWNVERVITDQASQAAIESSLKKRGLEVRRVPWTGRSSEGKSKHHRYGQFKTLLSQGVLRLVDDAPLRSELSSFTVSPSSSPPGYSVESRGPDDRADAAVMAVTEIVASRRPPNVTWA